MEFEITLSDTKTIRSRKVYDIISLVADISGFADIFMVFFGLIFNSWHNNYKLTAALIKHAGSVELKSRRRT